MDNVVHMRDFKRREEREAADVRLAKQIADTAPCELPSVWPDFQHSHIDVTKSHDAGNTNVYAAPDRDPA